MNRNMHADKTWSQQLQEWTQILSKTFPGGEARAISRSLAGHLAGIPPANLLISAAPVPQEAQVQGNSWIRRILAGEPVQYVLETAWFLDLPFRVSPAVLIPRPETEELVTAALAICPPDARVLDIGTGSGCIAISVKMARPDAAVSAMDISPEALNIAARNASFHHTEIDLIHWNILDAGNNPTLHPFDIIISNPPYIVPDEANSMEEQVLNHEPHLALFAPETQPLVFYHAILNLNATWHHPGTTWLFEINPLFADDLIRSCSSLGFRETVIMQDMSGKDRFLNTRR